MPEKGIPLNQILYGPPGTGKTFSTVNRTLEILDPDFLANFGNHRARLKERFDELASEGRIRFVTFHQSFSYEDFVEGIRAEVSEGGQLDYRVADGVFKELSERAGARATVITKEAVDPRDRQIWKMSLGDTRKEEGQYIFREAIENDYILLGFGGEIDFSGANTLDQVLERFAEAGEEFTSRQYPPQAVNQFWNEMEVGDLIVVSEGKDRFRAIGEVTGSPSVLAEERDDYLQWRPVRWLRVYEPSLPVDQLMDGGFNQKTLYKLSNPDMDKLAHLLAHPNDESGEGWVSWPGGLWEGLRIGKGENYEVESVGDDLARLRKPNGNMVPFDRLTLETLGNHIIRGTISADDIRNKDWVDKLPDTNLEPYLVNGYANILPDLIEHLIEGPRIPGPGGDSSTHPHVLIIDEINRGNVSRILGELITLLEPDKREGQPEATTVELPYSRQKFSVPANLYLIGTMNTADRSLTGLDVALRRRFTFEEIPPQPELLKGVQVEGIDVQQFLTVLNHRIEAFLDRDHRLGHSYFLSLANLNAPSLGDLEAIFTRSILPLLEEYFFEDWQRIHWVLNDHEKSDDAYKFIFPMETDAAGQDPLGMTAGRPGSSWQYNPDAPTLARSYEETIASSAPEEQ